MNGSLVADLGSGPGGLALPVAPGLPHAVLQVQPLLERTQPRPPAPVRACAGDDADRGRTATISPGRAYIWLFLGSGLWLVRCCGRPWSGPPAAAGAESERLGAVVPVGGHLGLLLAETVSLPVEEGAAPEPGRAVGREDRLGRRPRPNEIRASNGRSITSRNRSLPPRSSTRTAAGDRRAGCWRVLPTVAGRAAADRDRLAALRAADHRDGDGGVLPVAAVHADGAGG